MENTEPITLPLFSLKLDKIAKPITHTLTLLDNHLLYNFEAYMDKYPDAEDEAEGWIEPKMGVYQKIRLLLKKEKVCSVETSWLEDSKVWTMVITYIAEEHIRLKFKTQKELRVVEDIIHKWLLT